MTDHFGNFSRPPGIDLAVNALKEVQPSTPELPSPSFVADAVIPEWLACQRREWRYGVSDEAAGRMSI